MNPDKLKSWLLAASDAGLLLTLRSDVGTSAKYILEVIAGRRRASATLAGALEDFSERRRKKGVPLPELRRGDVSPTCADCPYYKECLKNKQS